MNETKKTQKPQAVFVDEQFTFEGEGRRTIMYARVKFHEYCKVAKIYFQKGWNDNTSITIQNSAEIGIYGLDLDCYDTEAITARFEDEFKKQIYIQDEVKRAEKEKTWATHPLHEVKRLLGEKGHNVMSDVTLEGYVKGRDFVLFHEDRFNENLLSTSRIDARISYEDKHFKVMDSHYRTISRAKKMETAMARYIEEVERQKETSERMKARDARVKRQIADIELNWGVKAEEGWKGDVFISVPCEGTTKTHNMNITKEHDGWHIDTFRLGMGISDCDMQMLIDLMKKLGKDGK